MKTYIEQRVLEIANFVLSNNATVRESAKRFGISKSTVHKDITERLLFLDKLGQGTPHKYHASPSGMYEIYEKTKNWKKYLFRYRKM